MGLPLWRGPFGLCLTIPIPGCQRTQVMYSSEPHPPYDRPVLSKALSREGGLWRILFWFALLDQGWCGA